MIDVLLVEYSANFTLVQLHLILFHTFQRMLYIYPLHKLYVGTKRQNLMACFLMHPRMIYRIYRDQKGIKRKTRNPITGNYFT